MKITKDTLHKVAHLARLNIKSEEKNKLLKDMDKILDWVDQSHELDTTDVKPLTHMTAEHIVLKEDVSEQPITRDQGLKNTPSTNGEYFKVPKVLKCNQS